MSKLKDGDMVDIKGAFVYWDDSKIYTSLDADIKLSKSEKPSEKKGDSNVDGDTNLADSVLIMQSIANPNKYTISAQGKKNADIYGSGDGITAMDALKIQRVTLKLEEF